MLLEAGLEVKVVPLSYASFMVDLQNGNYDLYIAEMRLGADMDFTKSKRIFRYSS